MSGTESNGSVETVWLPYAQRRRPMESKSRRNLESLPESTELEPTSRVAREVLPTSRAPARKGWAAYRPWRSWRSRRGSSRTGSPTPPDHDRRPPPETGPERTAANCPAHLTGHRRQCEVPNRPPNVPPLSCGRISKRRGCGWRRASPSSSTTGDRKDVAGHDEVRPSAFNGLLGGAGHAETHAVELRLLQSSQYARARASSSTRAYRLRF